VKQRKADSSDARSNQVKVRSLRDLLFDDEELLVVGRPGRLASLPKYVFSLGLYGMWRKRDISAVTDQRILLGKGLFRRDETSIPLDHVDDVAVARRGVYSYADVTIKRNGDTDYRQIGPMSPRLARRFAKEILRKR
jgi:hypothetical protein